MNNSNQNYTNYQQPGYQPSQTSGLAIASLVLGIISLLTCCMGFVSIICAVLAIIMGAAALNSHKSGRGMAIAGLVCGIIAAIPALYFAFTVGSLLSSL